jgi:uncharacterized phage protein (TIGR01671 family)
MEGVTMNFLFKAKRIDNGEWIEGVPYYGVTAGLEVVLEIIPVIDFNGKTAHVWAERQAVDADTLTQFTGRYDSKRKKIFAGDILKVSCTDEYSYEEHLIVKFDEELCGFRVYSDSGYTGGELPNVDIADYAFFVEIIDNEFDTKQTWNFKGI